MKDNLEKVEWFGGGDSIRVGILGGFENSPAIYGWVKRPMNFSSPVRDGRSLSSLTGLGIFERAKPRAKALGNFQTESTSTFNANS